MIHDNPWYMIIWRIRFMDLCSFLLHHTTHHHCPRDETSWTKHRKHRKKAPQQDLPVGLSTLLSPRIKSLFLFPQALPNRSNSAVFRYILLFVLNTEIHQTTVFSHRASIWAALFYFNVHMSSSQVSRTFQSSIAAVHFLRDLEISLVFW